MTAKRLAAGVVFLAALLLLGASSARAEETQIEFKSSLDASAQKAMAYVPDACKAKESPLLGTSRTTWAPTGTAPRGSATTPRRTSAAGSSSARTCTATAPPAAPRSPQSRRSTT